MTATRATDRVESSSSTSEERNASRNVTIEALRCSSATRATESACALARPNTTSTGRPATTSAKWPDSWASTRHFLVVSRSAYQPTNAMNTGTSGKVISTIRPVSGSRTSRQRTIATGTSAASTTAGR